VNHICPNTIAKPTAFATVVTTREILAEALASPLGPVSAEESTLVEAGVIEESALIFAELHTPSKGVVPHAMT